MKQEKGARMQNVACANTQCDFLGESGAYTNNLEENVDIFEICTIETRTNNGNNRVVGTCVGVCELVINDVGGVAEYR